VLLSRGDGTFRESVRLPGEFFSLPAAVSDFDRDGAPDLALPLNRSGNDSVRIWPGKGDGTFGAERAVTTGGAPYLVIPQDLNADSIPDLITGDLNAGDLAVLLGTGDGSFGPV